MEKQTIILYAPHSTLFPPYLYSWTAVVMLCGKYLNSKDGDFFWDDVHVWIMELVGKTAAIATPSHVPRNSDHIEDKCSYLSDLLFW